MSSTCTDTFVGSEEWEYLPGRKVRKGDRIRVKGGPVWKDSQGVAHRVGECGVFKFHCFAYDAKQQPFILVSGETGGSVYIPLVVKRARYGVTGWINRAYRFSKLRSKA